MAELHGSAKPLILIVEDNPTTAQMLELFLAQAGYESVLCETASRARLALCESTLDLVLLDLMLPDADGMELCREIVNQQGPPVIMLTARASEDDIVDGLTMGADDYICKPFRSRELLARIRLCLHRHSSRAAQQNCLTMGDIELDSDQHQLHLKGEEIKLTRSEFAILKAMLEQPGRVFARDQLIDRALGHDYRGRDRTIDTHIWSLRKKLAEPSGAPRYLHSEPGIGYRLWDRCAT